LTSSSPAKGGPASEHLEYAPCRCGSMPSARPGHLPTFTDIYRSKKGTRRKQPPTPWARHLLTFPDVIKKAYPVHIALAVELPKGKPLGHPRLYSEGGLYLALFGAATPALARYSDVGTTLRGLYLTFPDCFLVFPQVRQTGRRPRLTLRRASGAALSAPGPGLREWPPRQAGDACQISLESYVIYTNIRLCCMAVSDECKYLARERGAA
jgi:hypothetical protein